MTPQFKTGNILSKIRQEIASFILTRIPTLPYRACIMAKLSELLDSISERVEYEERRTGEIEAEQARLIESYRRYLELEEEKTRRQDIIISLAPFFDKQFDPQDRPALWEMVRALAQFWPTASITDVLKMFQASGIKTSRQAIESAVATHPEMFTTSKRGRRKFIHLKEVNRLMPPPPKQSAKTKTRS